MSQTNLALRPITPEDEAFLCRLYASTRQEEMKQSGWPQQQIDEFLAFQHKAQHTFYMENFAGSAFDIIMEGDTPIGRLYVDRRPGEIRIVDIALLPEHRGKGVGSRYLKQLMTEAGSQNKPVRIHVEMNNPALSLYKRLGFQHIEEQGVYYLMEWKPPKKV